MMTRPSASVLVQSAVSPSVLSWRTPPPQSPRSMYTTSVMVVSTLSSVVEVLGPDHVDSIYPSVFVTALHKGTGGALSAMHASKLISGLLHAACSPTARYCHIICSAPLSWQAGCGSEQGEHAAAVHGRCLRDALARRGLWRAAEHTSAQACVETVHCALSLYIVHADDDTAGAHLCWMGQCADGVEVFSGCRHLQASVAPARTFGQCNIKMCRVRCRCTGSNETDRVGLRQRKRSNAFLY